MLEELVVQEDTGGNRRSTTPRQVAWCNNLECFPQLVHEALRHQALAPAFSPQALLVLILCHVVCKWVRAQAAVDSTLAGATDAITPHGETLGG